MAKKQKDLTQDQLLEALKLQGRKLGFLVWKSDLPEAVKLETVVLISEMSLGQVEELLIVFEEKYTNSQTEAVDEEFKVSVKKLLKNYEKAKEEIELSFKNKLLQFEKSLNL